MIDFILDTEEKVRQKLDMLQSLADIQIASKLLEESSSVDEALIDSNYKKLNCKITPLDKKSKEWKLILEYVENTRQNWKIEVEDVFVIDRAGEDKKFNDKLHNHMLLWHGSRLSNFVGILSQGLRIAPPEAPVSGYLFGKGVYLADMIGKSANYCRSSGSNDTACALICEGALGTPRELLHSDYNASNLPAGTHSTKAIGRVAPDEKVFEMINGAKIPIGKVVNVPKGGMGHNEYIVYNENQVRMRYLVRMKLSSGGFFW